MRTKGANQVKARTDEKLKALNKLGKFNYVDALRCRALSLSSFLISLADLFHRLLLLLLLLLLLFVVVVVAVRLHSRLLKA